MKNKRNIVLIGFLALIIGVSLYYIKLKFYAPKKAIEEVAKLSSEKKLQNGDLIFQTSLSTQSLAIQIATHSKYSHCGLIFKGKKDTSNWYVLEAVQPVKWTRLDKWIARGKGGNYVIKRVAITLSNETLGQLRTEGEKFLGKSYDLTFEWSDEKIYCSELIWKAYNRTNGLKIGELQQLQNFDLSNPIVKKKLSERYKGNIPLNETVISPVSVFNSDYLETIASSN